MSDFELQRFSDRLDQAKAEGTITDEQLRLAKAALEGGGMEAALEALRASNLQKAGTPLDDGSDAPDAPAQADTDPLLAVAEDKADLRDELNRDLGSQQAVELIRKIAAVYDAIEADSDPAAE